MSSGAKAVARSRLLRKQQRRSVVAWGLYLKIAQTRRYCEKGVNWASIPWARRQNDDRRRRRVHQNGEMEHRAQLLVVMRDRIKAKRYSLRTEVANVHWVRRFVRFNRGRHPRELASHHGRDFLTHLAPDRGVSAGTQHQASLHWRRCNFCMGVCWRCHWWCRRVLYKPSGPCDYRWN